jgi:hypothetical protein
MAKRQGKPREIEVKANLMGEPLSVTRNGRRERVAAIYERWRLEDEWWGEEVKREYFRVRTSAGVVCEIYRNILGKQWYLSKLLD